MSEEARIRKLEDRLAVMEEEASSQKATLSFALPLCEGELRDAMDGGALRGNAQEFDNYLRKLMKGNELNDAGYKLCEKIRGELHECFLETPIWPN